MRFFCLLLLPGLFSGCGSVTTSDGVPSTRLGLPTPPDTCGGGTYANLIGRPVQLAPKPFGSSSVRISNENGPVTADYGAHRITFYYNEASGLIVGIKCG